MHETNLRNEIADALGWKNAHVTFEEATAGLEAPLRGRTASAFSRTVWELVEHIRIAQADLVDFCRNPDYEELDWPDDYWPSSPAPADDDAWRQSLAAVAADRRALAEIARDGSIDLTAKIPHGNGQTYLRELLLAIDHTAYHVGQIVAVRKSLGVWDQG